ncbi:hypothetical protein AGMMS50229_19740 [Campylobacterota bacterium]|nr:hypothetical protein AGMMS50229_19740 [Campylobacterota bacterium]
MSSIEKNIEPVNDKRSNAERVIEAEGRCQSGYGLFITEPAGEYHAKAKDYLSSHQLMDFVR